jgi:arabinofuranosyltransferase
LKARRHILIALALMLLATGYYLWSEFSTAGVIGFPLDDSWIHAQFARNLALGRGFSYNPGVPVSGSTAPLWTLIMAGGYLLTGSAVTSAVVIGVFFLGLIVAMTYALVRTLSNDGRQALFAAIMVGTLPRMLWAGLSGMEVSLAVALSLGGILTHVRSASSGGRRQYFSALLFGLATLARPECAVLFAASVIDRVLAATLIKWREMAAREWLLPLAGQIVIFLAVISPFLIFSRTFGIGFLPNTAYAKALLWNRGLLAALATGSKAELLRSFSTNPFDYLMSFLREALNNNPVLFIFAGIGILKLALELPYREAGRHRSLIIPLSLLMFPLAIGIVVPFGTAGYQEGRYIAPVAPLMLVVGTLGIYGAAEYGARVFTESKFFGHPARLVLEKSLLWLLILLAAATQFRDVWYRGQIFGKEVANIEQMQVTIGKWIETNVPDDALVAVNDLGAITYYSQRNVLDTVGLISPEVLSYRRKGESMQAATLEFLEAKRPSYIAVFPEWYPNIASRTDLAQPVYSVRLRENIVAGADEMVVYRMNWSALETEPNGDAE